MRNSISCTVLSALGLLICALFFIFAHWGQEGFGSLLKDPTADVDRFEGVMFVFFLSLSPGVVSGIGTVVIVLMGMKPKDCLIFYYSLILGHLTLYAIIKSGDGAQGSLYVLVIPALSCLIQVLVFFYLMSISIRKRSDTPHSNHTLP